MHHSMKVNELDLLASQKSDRANGNGNMDPLTEALLITLRIKSSKAIHTRTFTTVAALTRRLGSLLSATVA